MLIEFIKPDFEFEDERGTITQLIHDGWKQVNYITTKAGVTRGNHYHKNNEEAFYVITGMFELEVKDVKSGEIEFFTMKKGDFFVIKRYLNHSFKFLENTILLSFYSNSVVEENGKDIYSE